jgi:dipeptidase D
MRGGCRYIMVPRLRQFTQATVSLLLLVLLCQCSGSRTAGPSEVAQQVASYAVDTYADSSVAALADLVAFRTVRRDGMENAGNPEFQAMTAYLQRRATALGLDFADHGDVVVIGLGQSSDRLGIVTHGDVQPVDSTTWAEDPFSLDTLSEPGRLVARGTEDDKGPISTVLYAMRSLVDREISLRRRVELIVSYTEESDWAPFQEFLAGNEPPALNVALDAEYPVVVAEKGWGAIYLGIEAVKATGDMPSATPRLVSFQGGAFLSQIPAEAEASIIPATSEIEAVLRAAAEQDARVRFAFERFADSLVVRARGVSAHSSKPWEGQNAITHLAALLSSQDWPASQAAHMVRLIDDLVGTGDYAEQFGDLAYSHEFMGPLTLSLTTLDIQENRQLVAGINIRRPIGRSTSAVEGAIREAVDGWSARTGIDVDRSTIIGAPHYLGSAPHVTVLLDIYRHYTGQQDAEPISIGGGTHARLLPQGVNFGPAMPGEPYTGHSEHEYITRRQLVQNLEMYTAMLVELAGRK